MLCRFKGTYFFVFMQEMKAFLTTLSHRYTSSQKKVGFLSIHSSISNINYTQGHTMEQKWPSLTAFSILFFSSFD